MKTKQFDLFIAKESINTIQTFLDKFKKNVEGVEYTLSKPYSKIFRHPVLITDSEGHKVAGRYEERWHEIADLKLDIPEINHWFMLAYYKDGLTFIIDPSKELIFKNSNHGSAYHKCDVCGHYMKNSYVIENDETGEELQVGCECLTKFGINTIATIHKYMSKLYKLLDYTFDFDDIDDGEYPLWRGKNDAYAFSAVTSRDLLRAAKAYYNTNKNWKKGRYEYGEYRPSKSNADIQSNLANCVFDGDDEYISKVLDFGKGMKNDGEFSESMIQLASNFYAKPSDACYAFFLIKNYEDLMAGEFGVKKGDFVKVEGKVIATDVYEDYYRKYTNYTIESDNGNLCERLGKVPVVGNRVSFYCFVKFVTKGRKIILDRALKNPKKGYEVKII